MVMANNYEDNATVDLLFYELMHKFHLLGLEAFIFFCSYSKRIFIQSFCYQAFYFRSVWISLSKLTVCHARQ